MRGKLIVLCGARVSIASKLIYLGLGKTRPQYDINSLLTKQEKTLFSGLKLAFLEKRNSVVNAVLHRRHADYCAAFADNAWQRERDLSQWMKRQKIDPKIQEFIVGILIRFDITQQTTVLPKELWKKGVMPYLDMAAVGRLSGSSRFFRQQGATRLAQLGFASPVMAAQVAVLNNFIEQVERENAGAYCFQYHYPDMSKRASLLLFSAATAFLVTAGVFAGMSIMADYVYKATLDDMHRIEFYPSSNSSMVNCYAAYPPSAQFPYGCADTPPVNAVCQLVCSTLSDRHGQRVWYGIGAALSSIISVGSYWVSSVGMVRGDTRFDYFKIANFSPVLQGRMTEMLAQFSQSSNKPFVNMTLQSKLGVVLVAAKKELDRLTALMPKQPEFVALNVESDVANDDRSNLLQDDARSESKHAPGKGR